MCSRYNLTSPPEAVRAYFGYADTPNFPARYNIAPTQPIAVVARDREGTRRFRLMRWGLLPSFVKDLKQFPTPDQCAVGRCSGEGIVSQCHALAPLPGPGRRLLRLDGGVYERWRDGKGDEIDTVLPPEHFAAWLDLKGTSPEEAAVLLQSAPDDLFEAIEMHPKINDFKRDEPGILEPLQTSLL
jgi:putative SOS response-associated peptidase YedK